MRVAVTQRSALLLVDVQRDFCPGGALPVELGDKVAHALNEYVELFQARHLPVIASRDWHPANHISFRERGGPWPNHGVQQTEGAKFHPFLALPTEAAIVSKGMDPEADAYSAFQGTSLAQQLRATRVERVFLGGLPLDYAVKQTALDALEHGFQAFVLEDAARPLELQRGDGLRALEEVVRHGAVLVRYEELLRERQG
ncbi:MAG TPA: isochorismatase family protein [Candidatus Thermoplasmatota archaeon]|jgi:nicotinamidase/pyrazinamidase|nr:isochorismatase family protein [Candidatus Thermoplasmatota archaeon]